MIIGLYRSVLVESTGIQERDWAAEAGDIADGQPPLYAQRRKCKVNQPSAYLKFRGLACTNCTLEKRQRPHVKITNRTKAWEGPYTIINYAMFLVNCRARGYGGHVKRLAIK